MHIRSAFVPFLLALLALAPGCGGSTAPGTAQPNAAARSEEEVQALVASWDSPQREEWQRPDHVLELLAIEPGMTVVDIGAGTGYFLAHLSEAVGPDGHVIAVDVDPALVGHMRRRVETLGLRNVEVRQVSAHDPELPGGSVDRVLVVNTWPFIERRTEYAAHLHHALREGGHVLVVDYNEDSPHGPPEAQRTVPHHVADDLRHCGLHTEVVTTTLPYQFVVRASK